MALSVAAPPPYQSLTAVGSSGGGGQLSVQPYNGSGGLQGGVSPQGATAAPSGGASAPVSPNQSLAFNNSAGGTAGSGTSAAQAAADAAAAQAEAARIAKVTQYRGNITNLAKSIMDVYDSLYGSVDQAGAGQSQQVNQKYDTQTKGLTDQFNQDIPMVGASYASRGAFDSSYRANAEDNATHSFNNQLDLQSQGRQDDLAKVGQFVASTKGNINAEKGDINYKLAQINQTEDPNELLQLQNAIQGKLQAAQSDQSNLGTPQGYAAQAEALAPSTDHTAALRSQLSSIIQGQAAPVLKNSVGQKLIAASGLSPDDQQKLAQEFSAQISTQKQPVG